VQNRISFYLKRIYKNKIVIFYQNNRARPLHVNNRSNRRKIALAVFDLCRNILSRRWHRRNRHGRRTISLLGCTDYRTGDNL